jgi:hypothetical protein
MHSVELFERKGKPGQWSVEAIGEDGEICQAIFIGPEAKERAAEYAAFKYGLRTEPRRR